MTDLNPNISVEDTIANFAKIELSERDAFEVWIGIGESLLELNLSVQQRLVIKTALGLHQYPEGESP